MHKENYVAKLITILYLHKVNIRSGRRGCAGMAKDDIKEELE